MVRSEYLADFRRLVVPSTRLEEVLMVDYDCCRMCFLVELICGWVRESIYANDMMEK